MIPHKLRLKGFMCYREEQSLDFTGLHLACLAGENGHGKSTLLDAITWALWGKARAHRDDELITLDNHIDEMWVDFEFGLGGQNYRVWRQRSKRGRGQSDLHFYVEKAPGEWQLLDEGGLVERQKQIVRTLRMEYDTFANSAFVLQGKADSFTVKTPGERKQILADILGLGQYDLYEARAKDQIQARRERSARLQGEIESIDREQANRAEYEVRLTAARAVVAEASETVRRAEMVHAEARLAVAELRGQEAQLMALKSQMARAEQDLADLRATLHASQTQLSGFESILARRSDIEAGWAALEAARKQDAAFNAGLRQYSLLQEQSNQVRREVDQARAEIQAELRRLAGRGDDLSQRITTAAQQAALLEEVQTLLAQMDIQQRRRDEIAAEQRELSAHSAALRSELDRLKVEGQALREKMNLMGDAETAACPLCGQDLTPDHRDRMLADLAVERDALLERFQAGQAELKALAARREALDAEDADLAAKLRSRDARQRQAAQAEAAVAEGERAAAAHAALTSEMTRLEARLASGDFAHDAQVRLAECHAHLVALQYDPTAHTQVRETLERLATYDMLYQRQLLPALEAVDGARTQVQSTAAQLSRREAELAEGLAQCKGLEAAVGNLPQYEAELAAARAASEEATLSERRARQQEGAAMQRLDALAALDERRGQCESELAGVAAEIAIFTELREAFGKRGLQAMIIESAIPEIEVEANRLLSRMTEGRMSLRLETQRENVTGGVRETLDIRIADELGEREYSMYSGGEAFRANLALRIAISKLLARRAGAQLQTLVIDEGFGTQDAQGRDLLVQAINSIQSFFELVIVITHIEELKDLFPARIEVVKTASGSRISVG
jgi:exonuclease SbcC